MPTIMSDPLHDTHPTRQRIDVTVPDIWEHQLNLSLPPKAPSEDGNEAFAVLLLNSRASDVWNHAKLRKALDDDADYGVSYNCRIWKAARPVPSLYASFRGSLSAIRWLLATTNLMGNVIHSSEGFKS